MAGPYWETFQGKDGQWYWHLKAANGEIVAQGEAYESESAAQAGAEAAKRNAEQAED